MAYDGADFPHTPEAILLDRDGRVLGRGPMLTAERISVSAQSTGLLQRLRIAGADGCSEYRLRQRRVYAGQTIGLVKRPTTFWDWLFR